jgi:hypothetical protein
VYARLKYTTYEISVLAGVRVFERHCRSVMIDIADMPGKTSDPSAHVGPVHCILGFLGNWCTLSIYGAVNRLSNFTIGNPLALATEK